MSDLQKQSEFYDQYASLPTQAQYKNVLRFFTIPCHESYIDQILHLLKSEHPNVDIQMNYQGFTLLSTQGAYESMIQSIEQFMKKSQTVANATWGWLQDNFYFVPYSDEDSQRIEHEFQQGRQSVSNFALQGYSVDIVFGEVNYIRQNNLVLKRLDSFIEQTNIVWMWTSDPESNNTYSQHENLLIEKCYLQHCRDTNYRVDGLILNINGAFYLLDFRKFVQINMATGFERPIRRLEN